MNIITSLFGRKSITATWIANPKFLLKVDIDSGHFCGIPLGTPIEQLEPLGPSAYTRVLGREETLVYPQYGFQLFLDEARYLETVDINILAEDDMAAFTGQWHFRGQLVTIDTNSKPEQINTLLGTPTKVDGSNSLLYVYAKNEIWFEWGLSGQLENVLLTTFKE